MRLTSSNRFARFPTEWQTLCSTKRFKQSHFRSEEFRAALLFLQFKYQPLSLWKSPSVHIAGCNYYTVSASPRWGSSGATNAIFDQAVSASRLSIAVAREQHPFSIIQKSIHHPPSSINPINLLTSLHSRDKFPNKYLPLSLQKTEKYRKYFIVNAFKPIFYCLIPFF